MPLDSPLWQHFKVPIYMQNLFILSSKFLGSFLYSLTNSAPREFKYSFLVVSKFCKAPINISSYQVIIIWIISDFFIFFSLSYKVPSLVLNKRNLIQLGLELEDSLYYSLALTFKEKNKPVRNILWVVNTREEDYVTTHLNLI